MNYNEVIPEKYYKNVIKKTPNRMPIIFVVDNDIKQSDKLLEFMTRHIQEATFEVLPVDDLALMTPLIGIKYLGMPPTARDFGRYDYAFCDEKEYRFVLPAMLSGVKCFNDLEELEKVVAKPTTSIDRVDVYEQGKELLKMLKQS